MVIDRVVIDRVVIDRVVIDRVVIERVVIKRVVIDRVVIDRVVIDRVVIDRVVIDRVVIERMVIERMVIERMVIERMIAVSANHSNYLRRAHPETGINVARPRLRRLESLGGHDRADAAIGRNVEKLRGDDNRYGGDTGTYPDDTLREETLICAHFIVP